MLRSASISPRAQASTPESMPRSLEASNHHYSQIPKTTSTTFPKLQTHPKPPTNSQTAHKHSEKLQSPQKTRLLQTPTNPKKITITTQNGHIKWLLSQRPTQLEPPIDLLTVQKLVNIRNRFSGHFTPFSLLLHIIKRLPNPITLIKMKIEHNHGG